MNFRQFISLKEQGTGMTVSGFGAAGRAGQSVAAPEHLPTIGPQVGDAKFKPPPSAFVNSPKLSYKKPTPSGMAGGNLLPDIKTTIQPSPFAASTFLDKLPSPAKPTPPQPIKTPSFT